MTTATSSTWKRHIAPVLLILSAPCWWIGAFAFFQIVGSVYDAPDSATQIDVVSRHPIAWFAQNLCFVSGMLASAGGLFALTKILDRTPGRRFGQHGLLITAAATAVGVGVVYLYLTLAQRLTPDAPPMYSGAGTNPLHVPFAVLTLIGFVCYGVALVQTERLKWTGVAGIVLSSLMLVGVALHGDAFPPLFFYTVPLVFGIRLLLATGNGSNERDGCENYEKMTKRVAEEVSRSGPPSPDAT